MKDDILDTPAGRTRRWKGYTLDEINYQLALTEVAIEVQKDRVRRATADTLPGLVTARSSGASMLSRALGALNYVDYALIGFRLFKLLRRRRRK